MSNKLINETSPYLLQHADNPVEWYPWGEDAFEKSRCENKPIFLSVGYSTCHWCHVMAHESFENPYIAEYLNKNYVSVKVDREERPDIDQVYMRACQALTGSGGWPMSIFMLPDKRPFYAGTYFPPQQFLQTLRALHSNWQSNYKLIMESASQLQDIIYHMYQGDTSFSAANEHKLISEAVRSFSQSFDREYGGFGSAPKFPSPHNLLFLLAASPDMAETTLLQMYKGGIHDHIGGGFSRYSTDHKWLVPHFEKMLYDNALIAMAYTAAYALTDKPVYKTAVNSVFSYLLDEMRSPEGCFYAAQDADSDGVEGKYYVFTPDEIYSILGADEGTEFCSYYDITAQGNWEGKNIPNLLKHKDINDSKYTDARLRLKQYRKKRTSLHTDKKILTGWNALTAASLALAGRVFADNEYIFAACRIADFLEKELCRGSTLFSGMTSGRIISLGFLDDYAFFIFALIQLYKTTNNKKYYDKALELMEKTIHDFEDKENGGFFFSGNENETMIAPVKETYDGAIPSGNSVMTYNLIYFAENNDHSKFAECLKRHCSFMDAAASNYPAGHCFHLFSLYPAKKIICRDNTCRQTDEVIV